MEKLLTLEEVAEVLGVSERFVRNKTSRKAVPRLSFVRVGNRLRFRRSDVELFCAMNEKASSKNDW